MMMMIYERKKEKDRRHLSSYIILSSRKISGDTRTTDICSSNKEKMITSKSTMLYLFVNLSFCEFLFRIQNKKKEKREKVFEHMHRLLVCFV